MPSFGSGGGMLTGSSGDWTINNTSVNFTGLHFTKSSTDLYVTLTGGTDVPAEDEYDKTAGLSRVALHFTTYDSRGLSNDGIPAGTGRNAAQHRINAFSVSTRLDGVTWNSNRTELTVPLGFDMIKDATQSQWHTQTSWFSTVTRSRDSAETDRTKVHADIWASDVGEEVFNIDRLMPGGYYGVEQGTTATGNLQYSVNFYKSDNSTQTAMWLARDTGDDALIPTNGPSGTSVFDANGFSLSNIADVSSSAGATGDPHITTFGGDRYTL